MLWNTTNIHDSSTNKKEKREAIEDMHNILNYGASIFFNGSEADVGD